MKRASAVLLVLLAGAMPASAATITYQTTLSGAIEVPPNASPGTGEATLTVDTTAMNYRIQASFENLNGTTTVAHIHVVPAGFVPPIELRTGGVVTQVPSYPGFPAGVTAGTYDQTFSLALASTFNPAFVTANGNDVDAAAAAFLLALEEGRAYLNVHSSFAGGGEIRGFFAPAAVPEPGSLALLGAALVGAIVGRRRG